MADSLNSQQLLKNIYRRLKNDISKQIQFKQAEKEAKYLEDFLNLVKSAQKLNGNFSSGNLNYSKFWKKSEQLALLQELQTINSSIFSEGLMLQQEYNSSFELGSYLEHDLARIFKSFEASVTNSQNYKKTQKTYNVGKRRTQMPDLLNEVDEVIKEEFRQVYTSASKGLKEYKNQSVDLDNYVSTLNSVQGKIDIAGLKANLKLSTNLNDMKKQLVSTLMNASISAKNYISTNDIHLGQTNPFRVFNTAAYAVGESGSPQKYYRMVNCLQSHNADIHTQSSHYFYRIRAIYELTGAKMKYVNQDNLGKWLTGKYVKFLIINNPWGKVKVISTARIVNNLISTAFNVEALNWKDALYKPITLSQSSLEINQ